MKKRISTNATKYLAAKESSTLDAGARGDDTGDQTANDWRTDMIALVRGLIQQADPEVVEEIKWRKPSNGMKGVLVWSRHGILCTGESYKNAVKLTFAKGAQLSDPKGLFNASLEGSTRRAIDLHEGDTIDEGAFEELIREAIRANASKTTKRP